MPDTNRQKNRRDDDESDVPRGANRGTANPDLARQTQTTAAGKGRNERESRPEPEGAAENRSGQGVARETPVRAAGEEE